MGLTGLKPTCGQYSVPSEGPREFVSLSFPASRGQLDFLVHGFVFHLQNQLFQSISQCLSQFAFIDTSHSLLLRTLMITLGIPG